MTEVIVLAGGMGTRLREVVEDVPKPMAPICGKPFLVYLMDYLISFDVKKVFLSVGYKRERIQDYFGNHYQGVEIEYVIEDEPLGTGGAIKKCLDRCEGSQALVLNGDTFYKINYRDFVRHASGAELAMVLRFQEHAERYGCVEHKDGWVTEFTEKGKDKGWINGGIYLISKGLFSALDVNHLGEKFSFENDYLMSPQVSKKIKVFLSDDYFIDIGIPADYRKAEIDFKEMNFL